MRIFYYPCERINLNFWHSNYYAYWYQQRLIIHGCTCKLYDESRLSYKRIISSRSYPTKDAWERDRIYKSTKDTFQIW